MENANNDPAGTSTLKAFSLTIPMLILTFMMLSGQKPAGPAGPFALAVTYITYNAVFFLMIKNRKTDRYRAALYFVSSVLFVISFISHMLEARGTMAFTEDTLYNCQIPFCHIVFTMQLIPIALSKTIFFPGTMIGGFASIGEMIVLWIGFSLALGRGWCSWGCFFGGLDDGFSRFMKKAMIPKIDGRLKLMPYAVFIAVALSSAALLYPTYCSWVCPYKSVTEYEQLNSVEAVIKTIIFVSLFAALVIVLPLLTKKRTQCGYFCPFGAMQGATNYISPIGVVFDREKCADCMLCVKNCPTSSIDAENVKNGAAGISCVKCGKCVDICPRGAARFHVKGTPLTSNAEPQRLLFLYPAFLFFATYSGGWFMNAISKLVRTVF